MQNHFSTITLTLRMSAYAEECGELSFIFIESKPLVQQLGLVLYSSVHRSAVAQLR